jgi:hypothetical protein
MTQKQIRLVKYIKRKCKESGIKCDIRNASYTIPTPKIKCAGYFDDQEKLLVVAKKHVDFITTLIHEYCHLLQWKEQSKIWKSVDKDKSFPLVDKWLSGKEVKNYKQHLAAIRDLELDCEKRTVAMMKKWNIPTDEYIQKANAYVHFYNWIAETRRWSTPNNSPYTNKHVISVMSSKFNMQYDKLPKRIKQVFKTQNI